MKKTFLPSLLSICLMFSFSNAFGQGKYFVDQENVAINGYDLVSYFSKSEAVEGTEKHAMEYDGTTFYFSNKKNLKAFKKNPSSYLPAYGGFCAFGVAKANKKFPIDPTQFKIIDDKLYLFFKGDVNGKPLSSLDVWNKNEQGFLKMAEANWPKLNQ